MIDKEKLYDLIYDKADRLFKKYNPCEISKNLFGEICCRKTDNIYLCCTGCEYLSGKGCTVKCLACKLCFCAGDGLLRDKLHKLRRIAYKYDFYLARSSKEQVFNMQRV